jgi:DNA-binding response OmpR family regulator
VLVVDDEASMRLLCRINLELAGMDVAEAADAPTALAAARADPPDVILLDGMLPGGDGWAVATQLLADPRTAAVPIIFMSARAELSKQSQAIELGATAYLTKPFDPVGLADLIERVLGGIEQADSKKLRIDGRAARPYAVR